MKPKGFTNDLMPSRQKLKQFRDRQAKAIKATGRVCIGVMGKDTEDPAFAYTLGNHITQDSPEVITFYPSRPTVEFVLNNFSEQMKAGEVPTLSETTDTLVYGCLGAEGQIPVRARLLTQLERVMAWDEYTCQLPSVGIPVVVIDMPDPAGRWPEEVECAEPVRDAYNHQPFTAKSP